MPPQTDRRIAYQQYLQSPHWFTLRDQIRTRANYTCEACTLPSAATIEVHHLHYGLTGDWLDVTPDDLIGLCPGCHNAAHTNQSIRERVDALPRGPLRARVLKVALCPPPRPPSVTPKRKQKDLNGLYAIAAKALRISLTRARKLSVKRLYAILEERATTAHL